MQIQKEAPIGSIVSDAYINFGQYVNTQRAFPSLMDGLKVSYRRAFYSSYGLGDKLSKTSQVSGDCIGKYHPHGSKSVEDVISRMVHQGLLEGQGNHGNKFLTGLELPPAAPRYTEVKVADNFRDLMGMLIKYVPSELSDLGFSIPEYLPTPFPLILTFGGQGIGLGANCRIPAFTMSSMFSALMNNNANELRAPKGLYINPDKSDLQNLWDTGKCHIQYEFLFDRHWSEDNSHGVLITGNPLMFLPDLSIFDYYVKEGAVFIRDESTEDEKRVFIGRNPNVKKINVDEIYEMCAKQCVNRRQYSLSVSDGKTIYKIPMKDWVETTYHNYLRLIGIYKQTNIDKIQLDIDINTHLPAVAQLILQNPNLTEDSISTTLNISTEIVSGILSKSIRSLLNTDTAGKIAELTEKLKYFTTMVEADLVVELIDKFQVN